MCFTLRALILWKSSLECKPLWHKCFASSGRTMFSSCLSSMSSHFWKLISTLFKIHACRKGNCSSPLSHAEKIYVWNLKNCQEYLYLNPLPLPKQLSQQVGCRFVGPSLLSRTLQHRGGSLQRFCDSLWRDDLWEPAGVIRYLYRLVYSFFCLTKKTIRMGPHQILDYQQLNQTIKNHAVYPHQIDKTYHLLPGPWNESQWHRDPEPKTRKNFERCDMWFYSWDKIDDQNTKHYKTDQTLLFYASLFDLFCNVLYLCCFGYIKRNHMNIMWHRLNMTSSARYNDEHFLSCWRSRRTHSWRLFLEIPAEHWSSISVEKRHDEPVDLGFWHCRLVSSFLN